MNGVKCYVPLEIATQPAEGECITNRWWSLDPEKGLIFHAVRYRDEELGGYEIEPCPQCNLSKEVSERLTARLCPGAEVCHVPVVFMAHAERAARIAIRDALSRARGEAS